MHCWIILLFSLVANLALATGNIETYFVRPDLDKSKDTILEDQLQNLIGQADKGSSIYISVYHIYNSAVPIALLEAQNRGVKVYVITEKDSKKKEGFQLLRNGYGDLPAIEEGRIRICSKGCLGKVNNHNKFYLFSRLKNGDQHIVAQSSANLTNSQQRHYNDLIIFRDHEEMYEAFLDYWRLAFEKEKKHWRKKSTSKIYDVAKNHQVLFFPMKKEKDPVLDALSQIECQKDSVIRVSQSRFMRKKIARKLRSLHDQGCDVRVIARDDRHKGSPTKKVRKALGRLLEIFPYRIERQTLDSIHMKIMLIKAHDLVSKKKVHWVFTGSHNFNKNSLRNNGDVLLRINSLGLFQTYLDVWKDMRQAIEDYRERDIEVPPFD